MGCRTEPAAVHIAHVLQRLDFFQIFNFFYNLHDLPQKKNYTTYRKNKKIQFFFIIHTTYSKKKLHAFTAKKKLHDYTVFFVHDLHFSHAWGGNIWKRRNWEQQNWHSKSVPNYAMVFEGPQPFFRCHRSHS